MSALPVWLFAGFVVACGGEQASRSSTVAVATAASPAASSAAPSDAVSAPTLTPVAPDPPDAGAFMPPPSSPELTRARDPRLAPPPRKPAPAPDDDRYYAALDAERAGNLPQARERYLEIVREAPPSKHLGDAYFGLGELYLAESAGDAAKLDLAVIAFDKARATLPAKSPLVPFVTERQALVVAAIHARRSTRSMLPLR